MTSTKRALSSIFYALGLLVSVSGTAWLMYLHIGVWMRGHFVIGSMSGMVILEYVLPSVVLWLIGRILAKRPRWDYIFYVATAIPLLMMLVLPGRFFLGDL